MAILDEAEEEEEKVEEPTTSTNSVVNEEELEIMGMDYEQEEEIATMQRHLEEGSVVEDVPRSIVTIENCRFTVSTPSFVFIRPHGFRLEAPFFTVYKSVPCWKIHITHIIYLESSFQYRETRSMQPLWYHPTQRS